MFKNPQNPSKEPQNSSKGPQNSSQDPQNSSKGPQNSSKGPQNSSKGPQNPSKGPQNSSKESQTLWVETILENEKFLKEFSTKEITQGLKDTILKFANAVDSIYSPGTKKTELDSTHNDDICMLYFISHNKNRDDLSLINSIRYGWALSRLRIISSFRSIENFIEGPVKRDDGGGELVNFHGAFIQKRRLDDFKDHTEVVPMSFDVQVVDIYNELSESDRNIIIKFFSEFSEPTLHSQSVQQGGKKRKSVKAITPVKTEKTHKCKDGVIRRLYAKGQDLYVKMKNSTTGKFVYKKIKGPK